MMTTVGLQRPVDMWSHQRGRAAAKTQYAEVTSTMSNGASFCATSRHSVHVSSGETCKCTNLGPRYDAPLTGMSSATVCKKMCCCSARRTQHLQSGWLRSRGIELCPDESYSCWVVDDPSETLSTGNRATGAVYVKPRAGI